MAKIIKIEDDYYVEYFAQGLRFQKKAGKDLAAAEKMLAVIEKDIPEGAKRPVDREADLDAFVDDYLTHVRENSSGKTAARLANAAMHFRNYLKETHPQVVKLPHVTPSVIETYQSYLLKNNVHGRTVNFTMLCLRPMMDYAIAGRKLNDDPTAHVRFVRERPRLKPATVSDEDYQKVVEGQTRFSADVFKKRLEELRASGALPAGVNYFTFRNTFAAVMLRKGVPLHKLHTMMEMEDIAQIMRFAALKP